VTAGGTPFRTTQTYAVEVPGTPSFAPLFHAKRGGLDAGRWTNSPRYGPSSLSLTPVRISTNIQRLANVLASVGALLLPRGKRHVCAGHNSDLGPPQATSLHPNS